MNWELGRFVLVGAVNTLAGLMVIFGMKAFFQTGDLTANAVGYSAGLSISFVLNRSWTFRHDGDIRVTVLRFLVAFAIAYAANLSTVLALISWGGVSSYLAQTMGVPVYTLVFFLLCRSFAFRQRSATGATEHRL